MEIKSDLAHIARLLKSREYRKSKGDDERVEDLNKRIENIKGDKSYEDLLVEVINKDTSFMKMGIFISYRELNKYLKNGKEFVDRIKDLEQLQVNLFGLKYDSDVSSFIKGYGEVFMFTIYHRFYRDEYGYINFNLWVDDGGTALCDKTWKVGEYKDEIAAEIKEIMKKYTEGYIRCSGCGKWIKQKDIAGRFFAGVYCDECWEREWKERERQENYS